MREKLIPQARQGSHRARNKTRRAFFNQIAGSWDQHNQIEELTHFLEQLVPTFNLKSGQKVLDVGTGTGLLIPFLLQAVGPAGQILAIDFAEEMVKICKSKYAHLPNVSFRVLAVEQLDVPSESFDAVTCFGVFPHLQNKEEALHQINRVLKPNGKLIIAHALSSEQLKDHHQKSSSEIADDRLPEARALKQMLTDAGFKEIYIVDKPGCYLCKSTKETCSHHRS